MVSLFILILVHIISVLVSIDPDVYLLFLVVDQLFFDFKNIWDTTIKGREVMVNRFVISEIPEFTIPQHRNRRKMSSSWHLAVTSVQ